MPSPKAVGQMRPEASEAACKHSRNRSKASCGNCYRRKQKVCQISIAVPSKFMSSWSSLRLDLAFFRQSSLGLPVRGSSDASKRRNQLMDSITVNEAGSTSLCLHSTAQYTHTDHPPTIVRPEMAMQSLLGPQSGLHVSFFHP